MRVLDGGGCHVMGPRKRSASAAAPLSRQRYQECFIGHHLLEMKLGETETETTQQSSNMGRKYTLGHASGVWTGHDVWILYFTCMEIREMIPCILPLFASNTAFPIFTRQQPTHPNHRGRVPLHLRPKPQPPLTTTPPKTST